MPEERVIYISTTGVEGYLWLHAYDRLKQAIANDAVKLGLVPASQSVDTAPSSWINYDNTFDVRDVTVPIGELRVGFFCNLSGTGAHQMAPGEFWAWLLITDNPEVEPVNCGRVTFI